jgi:DNA-binding SARP family transcriptional activator
MWWQLPAQSSNKIGVVAKVVLSPDRTMPRTAAATATREAAAAERRLSLTGVAQVAIGERQRALESGDALLLGWLAIEGPTSRARLCALLFPDANDATARNSLRQRLFKLKKKLDAHLVAGDAVLQIAPEVAIELEGDAELLAGTEAGDLEEMGEWLIAQREKRRAARTASLAAAAEQAEAAGELSAALEHAGRLVQLQPDSEHAHRRVMRLHYLRGDRAAALAAYEACRAAMQRSLGAAPSPQTEELLATIRAARTLPPVARRSIPASVLRPPRLIGRDRERIRLRQAWSQGRAFWLLGEAGMGKTRLIADFIVDAFGAGIAADVLVAAARPGDAGVPYASLGRALRALVERRPQLVEGPQRGELVRVMPEIDRVAAARAGLGQHLTLQGAIEALLLEAHRSGLAALVLDDLHFADGASIEMLQCLVLADRLAALHWGFAQRPAENNGPVEALRSVLEEDQRVEALVLAPLDAGQMAELIESLELDGIDAAQLAPQLARHTGGNPMYALETLKHLIAGEPGALAAGLPRPVSVSQLIERRLRQLSAPALGLARVAAVAGVDFSIELAEVVLGTRALALADAWRELEAAQVLRGLAFAHDLVHETTLAGVPAPIAAHTHGAVAAFLEARGTEPARVAAHWLAAGRPQQALAALHAAADAARRAMRRKEEAEFLARAARIETDADDPAAFGSWRAMIDATWASDLNALDAPLFDALDAAASTPAQRAAAKGLRGTWEQERGNLIEAKRLCRTAIDLADAAGDEPTGVDARNRLAQILQFDGDFEAALALLQQLLPWAAQSASAAEQAEFYCGLGVVFDNVDRGREARVYHQRAIHCARAAGLHNGVVTILGNLAVSWASAGYMGRAIDAAREALQLAAAHDEASGCGASLPGEMHSALRDCGRYTEALRWVEPALAAEIGSRRPLVQCHLACTWMHLGQHARAQREIDAAAKAQAPDWIRAKTLQMRSRLALALERRADALLSEAVQIIQTQPGLRHLRASIVLDHALALEPGAALVAARGVVAEGERLELPGTALAGHIRAARFAAAAGLDADALMHARAALAVGEDIAPNDLYPAERWLYAGKALHRAGRTTEAEEVLHHGARWVRHTMAMHVPEPFQNSFLRANTINRQLLSAAG